MTIHIGAAALTNSVGHPNSHQSILRNLWQDYFDMKDAGKDDCPPLNPAYAKHIGLYEARYNGGSWKLAVIPRNGMLYSNNQRLTQHCAHLFFADNDDCVEFVEGGVRYNNVFCGKL